MVQGVDLHLDRQVRELGGGPKASSGSAEDAPGYPRTVSNCGQKVRITAPPRQAVSLNQGSTEVLLSLGLADRMSATATWTDPVLPGLRKANTTVPRLADNAPSFEKVLDKEPDFVSASFVSTLGKGGVATREQFEKLGVPTYVSPADCTKDNSGDGDGSRTTPLTMDDVYGEIRDLSQVFGVDKRGDALVGKLKARVTKATKGVDASGTSVLYWFANSESPYMAGCCGAPGAITHAVGAKNVFDDAHEEWPQINWETVAERNPDVLVIGDLSRKQESAETAAKKIAFLESNPVTRSMDAVRHKRYVLLSGQAMNPSIRTVDGIEKVADALRRFGLDR
ncbi:iron compound ABC transporter, periplasmic iron compound-binding protein [Streptomyces himastatinicus ATCC 53653]|uniref:Iron compound ABC transporter, periplasmic iron compound-binding protein n=1 Tax=Streptomyces himastatinicus ATCC 53653 TaxID=457427 RepID=D9WV65_9ACTN|nr:ABC transporter substrate-binding protein [Streptomyces himastatinicus]EFL28565.1 iron compound ABC transporter, periplasmic iron compound-binding protein [Streptomyces himastatinicus ATCC 53653]